MRNTIFAGLALTALAAMPATAAPAPALLLEAPPSASLAALAAQSQGRVRVWMDGNQDLYRPGERIRARVRSDRDGYLAVFHIDTNGDVDIIYPRSEHEEGWIHAGRTMTLGSRGGYDYIASRGGYGIGYIMAVVLDEPLELWRVRELYGVRTAGWDGNRSIFGDPFYAMDELTRAIVPEGAYGYELVDYATYHVGRRYRYPRYACYDGYGPWYHHRGVYWDDCDRVRIVLVRYPWYYDTYRWRGHRRVYYDRYYVRAVPARSRPLHGYKERTQAQAPPVRSASRRPEPAQRPSGGGSGTFDRPASSAGGAGPASRRPEPADRAGGGGSSRPDRAAAGPAGRPERGGVTGGEARDASGGEARTVPARTRPAGQDDAEPRQQDRPVEPSRERPTFQRRPQNDGGSRAEPRRESPPPQRQAEPRRESPPPQRQAEPRRESPPPQRQAEPRREAPAPRPQAQPRRESPPPSSSSGSSTRSSGSSSSSGSSAPPPRRPPDD